jgi:hypothetical protein
MAQLNDASIINFLSIRRASSAGSTGGQVRTFPFSSKIWPLSLHHFTISSPSPSSQLQTESERMKANMTWDTSENARTEQRMKKIKEKFKK